VSPLNDVLKYWVFWLPEMSWWGVRAQHTWIESRIFSTPGGVRPRSVLFCFGLVLSSAQIM
jgi:hypothetical protein